MGLRRAVVALGILGGAALPASCVQRQLACVDNEAVLGDREKFYPYYRSVLAVENAFSTCCKRKYMKYFAIGASHWSSGHHTGYVCAHTAAEILGDGYEHKVDDSNCDVGCPGLKEDYNATKSGFCGGGCKGCDAFPNGDKCVGDPKAECGMYRSVYSCDDTMTKLPPPPHTKPPQTDPSKSEQPAAHQIVQRSSPRRSYDIGAYPKPPSFNLTGLARDLADLGYPETARELDLASGLSADEKERQERLAVVKALRVTVRIIIEEYHHRRKLQAHQ